MRIVTSISAAALLFAACTFNPTVEFGLAIQTVPHAVEPDAQLVVAGDFLVYFASEAAQGKNGTDLNGDGDKVDQVAVFEDMRTTITTVIGAAAERAVILGEEVFLEVEEAADGKDWDKDGTADDLVLLHWKKGRGKAWVDTLRPALTGSALRVAGGKRVYYGSTETPTAPGETSLRYVSKNKPRNPSRVFDGSGAGLLHPIVVGVRERLVFLALDETVEGQDLNGDGPADDPFVLGLLDGTDAGAEVLNTGLAADPALFAYDARRNQADDDWLVAFLVSEAGEGANLNAPGLFDPAWEPAQCVATPDVDTGDQVLHYLRFDNWAGGAAVHNTGLAGSGSVVALNGDVGVVSTELDANCDLNADGDTDDTVVRWTPAMEPILPETEPSAIPAIAVLPGGAGGLTSLGGAFVVAVDEAADGSDRDGNGEAFVLLAWLDPDRVIGWEFEHRDPFGNSLSVALSWLAAAEDGGLLALGFDEDLQGESLNTACGVQFHDDDLVDTLPGWVQFNAVERRLVVAAPGIAAVPERLGTVIQFGTAFFRASEEADGLDHNGDGELDDVVLMRNSLLDCDPTFLSSVPDFAGPCVASSGPTGGAFIGDEKADGQDYNGDGDAKDFVVRYFVF